MVRAQSMESLKSYNWNYVLAHDYARIIALELSFQTFDI